MRLAVRAQWRKWLRESRDLLSLRACPVHRVLYEPSAGVTVTSSRRGE